jgi:DNA polymerase III delta prime subunit
MNSFLLTGGDQISRKSYIDELLLIQSELVHLMAEKTTLTIKQVKDLQIPLSVAARIPRLVWIEEANLLTIPAQNALLKMLEEPPELTSFYLSCQSPTMLLPTIRSRTTVIALEKIENDDDPSILADLKAVMSQTPGDRLASIVKRDRAESIMWLTQIETALKDKLHGNVSPASAATLAKIAKSALQAHRELLANCSVGLVTQVFYLSLPKTRVG